MKCLLDPKINDFPVFLKNMCGWMTLDWIHSPPLHAQFITTAANTQIYSGTGQRAACHQGVQATTGRYLQRWQLERNEVKALRRGMLL